MEKKTSMQRDGEFPFKMQELQVQTFDEIFQSKKGK